MLRSRTSTRTSLTARPAALLAGQRVRLTATVSCEPDPDGTSLTPSGTVSIRDGALLLGSVPLHEGRATLEVRLFSVGVHVLEAGFEGEPRFAPSGAGCELDVVDGRR